MADSTWPLPTRDLFAHISGEIALASILTGSGAAVAMSSRVAQQAGFGVAWLSLAGVWAALAVVIIFFLRTATGGLHKAFPDPSSRATLLFAGAIWIILSVALLSGFGSVLSAVTHHRGLGATTFAVVGGGVVAVCALVAWRLAAGVRSISQRPVVAWTAFVLACVAVGAAVYVATRRESGQPEVAHAVADAGIFLGAAIATSRIRLPSVHKRVWVPITVVFLVLLIAGGISLLHRLAVAPGVRDQCLIVSPALDLIAEPDTRPKRRSKPKNTNEPAMASSTETPTANASSSASTSAPVVAPQTSEKAEKQASAAATLPEKPDIIVVTLDAVRADHLGCYGYERKTSPGLDALAAKAVVFERAYAAGPETRTAMAPLVTCKHLVESVRDSRPWPTLLRANETVAERLRAGGYATAAVSSFQWLSKARGFDQGFDVFDEAPFKRVRPEKDMTGAHAVAQAMAAYDQMAAGDKPLFLWVHLFDAHESYLNHESFDFGKRDIDRYDSEIAYLDNELSRLLTHVSQAPRSAKTVWIVHGSHGEAFGEHGFRGHPPKLFEEVLRVPLLIQAPGIKGRRVTDAVVSVLDVPATVLSLATGEAKDCSGVSLVDLVQEKVSEVKERPMLLVAYDGLHGQAPAYGWLDSRVKYVLYAWREGERTRLFDLRADPREQTDLRQERPDQAISLRNQLDTHLQKSLKRLDAVEP
ncbi:MAG TPA: sulfatase [Polyangiaceae bacterium]|nr:sulfatase [Polyangiaceae bacterium]HNZ22612.1 sulfatase [Polyangiaceae bacterium]HOD21507.1 sulfatase [Polyangiaceae bacterium]HOE48389.1 sulfatase [Polyangiaceae bacterium]HOH00281.1 sulfatase [Polyangiaceae bacterium]